MASRIAALPIDVVNLIAAGEVIDSLAAVVRELAENALDAGATRVVIGVDPDRWQIRVADNGAGMDFEDLMHAAAPHSTSKICDRPDLTNIRSLGFRGEALHSLAQLADLEIISRTSTSLAGWRIEYDAQGQPVQTEPIAVAPGTIVTAQQIFADWPARRAALPPLNQQLRAIQTTIYQLALCHPQVTWQVQQSERSWFSLWAGKTPKSLLPQMLRDVQISDLQELSLDGNVDLTIGLPDRCHRHRPDWIYVAVNGRCVDLPEVEQTILASFRRTLPRDRFPVCFVHLRVPPDQIDWNRQPAKSEIYLTPLDQWREQVATAIDRALRLSSAQLPESLYTSRIGQVMKAAETEAGYHLDRTIPPSQVEASELIAIRAIAQIHQMYILAEHPTGVWLIEQHIAHERVLYEQLCDRWQVVDLAEPLTLANLLPAQVEQLQRIGIALEPFGEDLWLARTAPDLLATRPDCAAALLELSSGGDLQTAQVATACRSAIRNGTPLTIDAMQTLLDQWQQTRNPRTCPHGRPICLTLEESSLSRFFRRHWVLGKSHGI